MAELGTKYECWSCGAKFYDLGRTPALCPKCGTDQAKAEPAPAPTRPEPVVAPPPVAKSAPIVESASEGEEQPDFEISAPDEDVEEAEVEDAELVFGDDGEEEEAELDADED